jgi:hypothetical protein
MPIIHHRIIINNKYINLNFGYQTDRQTQLRKDMSSLSKKISYQNANTRNILIIAGILAFIVGIALSVFGALGIQISTYLISSIVLAIGGFGITAWGLKYSNSKNIIDELTEKRNSLEKELVENQEQIKRFESYVYSYLKEFLIDLGLWEYDKLVEIERNTVATAMQAAMADSQTTSLPGNEGSSLTIILSKTQDFKIAKGYAISTYIQGGISVLKGTYKFFSDGSVTQVTTGY